MSKLLPDTGFKSIRVELLKSTIRLTQKQISTVRGLGLKKIGDVKIVANTPENRGMINAMAFLFKLEGVK